MKTKKLLTLILALFVLTAALVSCGRVEDSGTATVVVETSENGETNYEVYYIDLSELKNKDEGALSLINHLLSDTDSGFVCDIQDAGYGAYVNSVSTLVPDTTSEYIAIYTSEKTDFAVPSEWQPTVPTVKYGDMILTYSGVGLSSMTVKDGTVILLRLETF